MENEIMNNEVNNSMVVIPDEESTEKSGNGLGVAAGIGLCALAGFVAYKGIKFVKAKIKSKKEKKEDDKPEIIEGDAVESKE